MDIFALDLFICRQDFNWSNWFVFTLWFEKNDNIISSYLKVNEATNIYSKLHDQTKFRWNEINKNKDYFNAGIQERKKTSKKLFLKKKTLLLLIILRRR